MKTATKAWIVETKTNLLRYSNDFSQNDWVKYSMTLTTGQTDPVAGTDATRLTATATNAFVKQAVRYKNGSLNRVLSIYVKRVTGTGDIKLTVDGTNYETITTTGSWARFETTAVAGAQAFVGILIATSGDEVDIYQAQVETGDTATAYAGNTDATFSALQITDPDYPINTVRGAVFMDGFFFVMTPAGEIYQSALQDGFNWNALEFIQSQNESSYGVCLAKIQSYIVVLKEWVIEFMYNAANAVGSVLAPVQNMTIQLGCASADSVKEVGGNLVWISQTRLGYGRSVVLLTGVGQPQRISTPAVDNILELSNLNDVYSWVAQTGSHTLYAITLVDLDITLAYDFTAQTWGTLSVLEEIASGTVESVTAAGVLETYDFTLKEGDIVRLSEVNSDFDGWWPVSGITGDSGEFFQLPTSGTAYTDAAGVIVQYRETIFPIRTSVNARERQYMQDATSGTLYEFSQSAYTDAQGAIPARIRTAEMQAQTTDNQFLGKIELLSDRVDSNAFMRWSNDDYQTWTKYRSVDLDAPRAQLRRCGDFRRRAVEVLHLGNKPVRFTAIEIE